jgi:hypothetical protein
LLNIICFLNNNAIYLPQRLFNITHFFNTKQIDMNKNELKALRTRLPKGYANILSDSTGFSNSFIYQVLHGMRNSDKVIKASHFLAEQYENRTEAKIKDAVSGL